MRTVSFTPASPLRLIWCLLCLVLCCTAAAAQATYYEIVVRHTGKCLDVDSVPGPAANGAKAQQWQCVGGPNQHWEIVDVGDGYVRIVSRWSGKSLDVDGVPGPVNGARVQQWDYLGGANQQWQVIYVGGGYYRIVSRWSGKALDIDGAAGAMDGARAQQWDYLGGHNQQWQIRPLTAESGGGQWTVPFALPVVPIHTHLLPNGKVLFWSRDKDAAGKDVAYSTQAHIWDPADGAITQAFNNRSNLFCSGHSLLPDGRLLVTGGHKVDDFVGLSHANIFNFADNSWTPTQDMNAGRWYPTNTTLSSGEVLVVSGTNTGRGDYNKLPQVWSATTGAWRDLAGATYKDLPLYPWMYQAPNGRVFYAGPGTVTEYLDTTGAGAWSWVGNRTTDRHHGSSVMYGNGKVLVVGGDPATNTAEVIDLTTNATWHSAAPMVHPRIHANATLLPDGRVLLTGGENGGGPVKAAELWDPGAGDPVPGTSLKRGSWSTMASAARPRLYHSTAILLPDGRVMSAGGGLPGTVYKDAEIYAPPYLFRGARPRITDAPQSVGSGQRFFVGTPDANITRATLVRLSSVTHSFNENQRFYDLSGTIARVAGGLHLTAPADNNLCPPGHYMLFLLNDQGVPSVARIIRVAGGPAGIDPAAYYRVIARHSGKVLDVQWGSLSNGAPIWQWDVNGSFAQQWRIEPLGNGNYKITAKGSNKALDVREGSLATGAVLQQWDYVGNLHQQWRLEPLGEGYYRIVAAHSGKVLDVQNARQDNGAPIWQWDINGTFAQQWRLERVP